MINFIKGFIIGIGKIIPGVSGAMLATIMGVYDKSIFYKMSPGTPKKPQIPVPNDRIRCELGVK